MLQSGNELFGETGMKGLGTLDLNQESESPGNGVEVVVVGLLQAGWGGHL